MHPNLVNAAACGMYATSEIQAFWAEELDYAHQARPTFDGQLPLQAVADEWTALLRYELYEALEARTGTPDLLRLVKAAEAALAEQLEREPETEADLEAFQAAVSAAGRPDPAWARDIDLDDLERMRSHLARCQGRPDDWDVVVTRAFNGGVDATAQEMLAALDYLGFSLTSQQEVAYRWLTGQWAWQAQPAYPRSVARKVYGELLTLHLVERPSYDLDWRGLTRLVNWYVACRAPEPSAPALVPVA